MADTSREKAIIRLLEERGYISVQELSKCLYVSQPTVRRTLTDLEREGIVQRSHGGVILASNGLARPMSFRVESMQKEKRVIARAAADMVDNGNVIFLDTSTTARCLINYLRNKRNITVITNSLPALTLLQSYNVTAKCTGGDLNDESLGFVGHHAEQYIADIYADVFFFSTPCISNTGRISDYSEQETYIRKRMLKNAKKKVFLFHSAKFNQNATFTICDLHEVDYLISDMDLQEKFPTRVKKVKPVIGRKPDEIVHVVSTKISE